MDNEEFESLISNNNISDISSISSSSMKGQSIDIENERQPLSQKTEQTTLSNNNQRLQQEGKVSDNENTNHITAIETESQEIIDRQLEQIENYIKNSHASSSTPDITNNSFYDSIISISSDFSPEKNTQDLLNNEKHKMDSLDSSSGLIKKLKNENNVYIEIVIDNKEKGKIIEEEEEKEEAKVKTEAGMEVKTTIKEKEKDDTIIIDTPPTPKLLETPKVVRKRGRPRKKKKKPTNMNAKEKTEEKMDDDLFMFTPQKTIRNFNDFLDNDDDDNLNHIIPTAEELFDKSFHECSRKSKNRHFGNLKNENPFSIIDSIFSSSDDDDIFVDKTLKIPGEGVLAYYKYDRKYHPAKILTYQKKYKNYKLLFWTGYKLYLKRKQFYTKYQPEFLTVELGEQRSENDDSEMNSFTKEELNNFINKFIGIANDFLKKNSWRYKDFINLELNTVKTYQTLIKNTFLGFLSNSEIEYTIDQFKLALVKKTLILEDLPMTIDISEEKLIKILQEASSSSNNRSHPPPQEDTSRRVTRQMKKKMKQNGHTMVNTIDTSTTTTNNYNTNLPDSQRTNESDTIMSSLGVNELSYIDKLCRYVLLPEFSIWVCMQEEDTSYAESEKLCRNYENCYDWVTEILHYRETFASGRHIINEHH